MTQNPDPVRESLSAFLAGDDTHLPGGDGPLAGLTFASKDIFDVAGRVTGAGNPAWQATHGPAEPTPGWCSNWWTRGQSWWVRPSLTN